MLVCVCVWPFQPMRSEVVSGDEMEGAVAGMLESYGAVGNAMTARAQGAFMTQAVVGSPASCTRQIESFLRDCDIVGLMFIYDDYARGIAVTGEEILPHLRRAFA